MGNSPTRHFLVVPIFVTAAAPILGMFLHFGSRINLVWESLYGIGFFFAGFVFHPYALNRTIGIIGGLLWPLLVTIGIYLASKRLFRASAPLRIVAGFLYAASLCVWVDQDQANRLVLQGWPIYFNYFFTNF